MWETFIGEEYFKTMVFRNMEDAENWIKENC